MRRWHFSFWLILMFNIASGWYITPPRQNSEWNDMAKLIVKTFDAPSVDASQVEKIRWTLFEETLTQTRTLRQYTETAKRMKGKKYCIFVAKQLGQVIGMVEVGINGAGEGRRPTIGLICVEEIFRQQGVAADLMAQCEHLVARVWKEKIIYAEVEESNKAALYFFQSQGFLLVGNQTVNVNVRQRLGLYERPHLLLSKHLPFKEAVDEAIPPPPL